MRKHYLQKHKIQDWFYNVNHAFYKLAMHTLGPTLRKGYYMQATLTSKPITAPWFKNFHISMVPPDVSQKVTNFINFVQIRKFMKEKKIYWFIQMKLVNKLLILRSSTQIQDEAYGSKCSKLLLPWHMLNHKSSSTTTLQNTLY